MATVSFDLSEDELSGLAQIASSREITPEALAQRWIRERLVHERERAGGGGKAMSPRARREQEREER